MARKKKGKGGRRNKAQDWLTEDGLELIKDWARAGLSNVDIRLNIGISETTFYRWQQTYREFREALAHAREIVDAKVENALIKSATGYFVEEEKAFKVKTGRYTEELKTIKVKVWVPPNPQVQMFVNKNRRPEEWSDKPELAPQDIEYRSNVPLAEGEA